ncbi:MAG: succinate--CoA ligase subunit alpha [Rectinemataceae bacterium]|nr:succinate--CoA ligase subunit alpha [Spirochaetaceae bacterium]
MSILIDTTTRVLVMGATGAEGSFWTGHMMAMGTHVIAAVTPGKEGERIGDLPVFHSVRRAIDARGQADAAMLFVPPRFTKDAVFECLDAGIRLIVTAADGIPLHDALQIRAASRERGCMVVGGNTSGIISPGKAMLGMFPYWIERVYKPGTIGVMTRSGSLTNEVTSMVVRAGFGVSTLAGVGGDPVPGMRFAEVLRLFEQDSETEAVVMIGELGGTMEEEVADQLASGAFTKPLVAFIGGRHAPEGKRMGHAGAITSGGTGGARYKMERLRAAGALVAERASQTGTLLAQALHR